MSIRAMARVWSSALPRDEKYILLCLADFGNDEGEGIYPAIGYIVWKTAYSETQVKAILRKLQRKRIITVEYEASKYDTNEYKIILDRLPARPPYRPPKSGRPTKPGSETDPALDETPKVGAVSEKVGAVSEKVGAKTDPNPPVNPLENPSEELTGKNGKKGDMMDGMIRYAQKDRPDVAHYPEEVREIVACVCECFGLVPPRKMKGSEYGCWIEDSRLLAQAGGAETLATLRDLSVNPYDWMNSATISRPGALIKAVRARSGEIRRNTLTPGEENEKRQRIREAATATPVALV